MRKIYETALILIGTIGWWGFVYPDMCLTEDVYEQECDQESVTLEMMDAGKMAVRTEISAANVAENEEGEQSGWKIGDIRIKSRVLEYLYQER